MNSLRRRRLSSSCIDTEVMKIRIGNKNVITKKAIAAYKNAVPLRDDSKIIIKPAVFLYADYRMWIARFEIAVHIIKMRRSLYTKKTFLHFYFPASFKHTG